MNETRSIALVDDNTELVLPVTPSEYERLTGNNIETANIYGLGDVHIASGARLDSISITSLLPAMPYLFVPGSFREPAYYIDVLQGWQTAKSVIRYIVRGTTINIPVLVESLSYGERDGTNDIYYTLTLAEYRYTETVEEAEWTIPPKPQGSSSSGSSNGSGNSGGSSGGSSGGTPSLSGGSASGGTEEEPYIILNHTGVPNRPYNVLMLE